MTLDQFLEVIDHKNWLSVSRIRAKVLSLNDKRELKGMSGTNIPEDEL